MREGYSGFTQYTHLGELLGEYHKNETTKTLYTNISAY